MGPSCFRVSDVTSLLCFCFWSLFHSGTLPPVGQPAQQNNTWAACLACVNYMSYQSTQPASPPSPNCHLRNLTRPQPRYLPVHVGRATSRLLVFYLCPAWPTAAAAAFICCSNIGTVLACSARLSNCRFFGTQPAIGIQWLHATCQLVNHEPHGSTSFTILPSNLISDKA